MNEITEKLSEALDYIGNTQWQCAAKERFVQVAHTHLRNLNYQMESAVENLHTCGEYCMATLHCNYEETDGET